jgi:hypothetical protein
LRRERLWPFPIRIAVLWTPILFIVLILGLAILRQLAQWPPPSLDQSLFLAILFLSLIPILLAIVDFVAERGGSISFRGLTLDFAAAGGVPTQTVPVNVGLPGQPVYDSGTENIVAALRAAVSTEAVVVDLQDGSAWWETRLVVLLAGAKRLGRPNAVVFVGLDGGISGCFQGWAPPEALLPLLLRADRRYRESYERARAWFGRWELTEPPVSPPGPRQAVEERVPLPGLQAPHPNIAIEDGLLGDFAFERLLQSDLGAAVEGQEEPRTIGLFRLQELFRPVLRTRSIDDDWPPEKQVDLILSIEDPYLAVTHRGRYVRLIPRLTGIAAVVRSVTESQRPS